MPYANNKGADQPAHPRSLISTFVVRYLDGIMSVVSISEISSLYVASVAAQAGLCLPWSQTPKTGFLMTRLKCNFGVEKYLQTSLEEETSPDYVIRLIDETLQMEGTVNYLNIRTPKNFVVITLKFELCGSTIE